MRGERKGSRGQRIGRIAIRLVTGLLLVGVAACTLLLLGLRLPVVQKQLTPSINAALGGLFRGQIVIERLGILTLNGVRGASGYVLDPQGRKVLGAQGLRVDCFWPNLVWQAVVTRPARLSIEISGVHLEQLEVRLIDDGNGTPTLVRSFDPREPNPPSPESQEVQVRIPTIRIGRGSVRGKLSDLPTIDAEIRTLSGQLSVLPARTELQADLETLEVRRLPGNIDVKGRVSAGLGFPSQPTEQPTVQVKLDGTIAKAPATVDFGFDGGLIRATLDAPKITAETLRSLGLPLRPTAPIHLHAEAHGPAETLRLQAKVEGPAGTIGVQGNLWTAPQTRISAQVSVSDLDLSELLAETPKTSLTFDAKFQGRLREGAGVEATYQLRSSGGTLGNWTLPSVRVTGTGESTHGAFRGKASVEVDDPGLSTRWEISLDRLGQKDGLIEFTGQVNLDRPRRLLPIVSTRGKLGLVGLVQPALSRFEAQVSGTLAELHASDLSIQPVTLKATGKGSFENPELSAELRAQNLVLSGRKFETATVNASGNPRAMAIHGEFLGGQPDSIQFRTQASLNPELVLANSKIWLKHRESSRVVVAVETAQISPPTISIRGFELTGAGEARGELTWSNGLSMLKLATDRLRPAEILAVMGIESPLRAAVVSLEAEYANRARRPEGRLHGTVNAIRIANLEDGSLGMNLSFRDRTVEGMLVATGPDSHLWLSAESLVIPAPPYDFSSLDRVQGALNARGRIGLDGVRELLTWVVPLSSAAGELRFDLHAKRSRAGKGATRASARIETSGLELVGRRTTLETVETTQTARDTEPWSVENLDLSSELELDTGAGLVSIAAKVRDREGDVLVVNASARPGPTAGVSSLVDRDWTQVPLDARLTVPSRDLQKLPEAVRVTSLRGIAQLEAVVEGTLRTPKLQATASFSGLRTLEMKQGVDLSLSANLQPPGGHVEARASLGKTPIGQAKTQWTGELWQLARALSAPEPSPIQAELQASLSGFPLELVPALADQRVRGRVTGSLSVRALGTDAQLEARFQARPLLVGPVRFSDFNAQLKTDQSELSARVEAREPPTMARATLRVPIQWGNRLFPKFEQRLQGQLFARDFPLNALTPLVAGQLNELDGQLDASIEAAVSGDKPRLKGRATVRRGVVHLPIIGQRFRDIEAEVNIEPGRAQLERFTARGITGKLEAKAVARLDGLDLLGVRGSVQIDKDEAIPVTFEGSAIGDAWGRVELSLDRTIPNTTRITLDVPELTVKMPETPPAALQDLELPEEIRVGTRLPDGDFVTMPTQPLERDASPGSSPGRTRLAVNLGNSVWIRRGTELEVQLGGGVTVDQGTKTEVAGSLELRGGTLDVQGKRFEIERGTVTFTGHEPANPTILAVAAWDSPEGYTVYAEYTGTAEEGTLSLRSEPPLTNDEIVNLLMFGTPDGSFGSDQGGGTAQAALGVFGGTVTQGLNRALSNFTKLDVSARLDTSTGSARPELVIQLSPRLTARVTRAVGEPAIGQTQDRTTLTLDVRLFKSWSLSTAIGDRGSSVVDLIWRKRY